MLLAPAAVLLLRTKLVTLHIFIFLLTQLCLELPQVGQTYLVVWGGWQSRNLGLLCVGNQNQKDVPHASVKGVWNITVACLYYHIYWKALVSSCDLEWCQEREWIACFIRNQILSPLENSNFSPFFISLCSTPRPSTGGSRWGISLKAMNSQQGSKHVLWR